MQQHNYWYEITVKYTKNNKFCTRAGTVCGNDVNNAATNVEKMAKEWRGDPVILRLFTVTSVSASPKIMLLESIFPLFTEFSAKTKTIGHKEITIEENKPEVEKAIKEYCTELYFSFYPPLKEEIFT